MKTQRFIFCFMLVVTSPCFAKAAKTAAPPTISIMQSIFNGISFLLPLSFDEKRYSDNTNLEIQKQLKLLEINTELLDHEPSMHGPNFGFLAKNLYQDAKEVKHLYDISQFRKSAFVLQNLTENCFACHSKFSKNSRVPTPEKFYRDIKYDTLSSVEQAKILVISRQFDMAQKKYEEYLQKHLHQDLVFADPVLEQYLLLSIGTQKNLNIPKIFFQKLLKQKNISSPAKATISAWIKDLEHLDSQKTSLKVSLRNVRDLIQKAKLKTDYLHDKQGLIYWTVIHSLLNELTLAKHSEPVNAELYYWLGVTATMFEHSYWVAQMPFYLEKAIRANPHSDIAKKAYQLLEKNTIIAFTGSSGTNVPEDETKKLLLLKQMVFNQDI